MKKLILLTLLCLSVTVLQAQVKKGGPFKIDRGPVKIDSVIFYTKFVTGATTVGAMSYFQNPGSTGGLIDTTHQKTKADAGRLAQVMNNAKRSRHLQQKIGGIDLAGKFYTTTGMHYFIICGNGWMVDLTGWRNFEVKNPEDREFLQNLISGK